MFESTRPARREGVDLESLALTCSNCGAPLSVPKGVELFTCAHCQSQLSLQTASGVYFTSVLNELGGSVGRVADEVKLLRLQGELSEHERAWEQQRERLKVRDGEEPARVPTRGNVLFSMVPEYLFCLLVAAVFWFQGNQTLAVVGGLALCGAFSLVGLGKLSKARDYQQAHREYTAKKSEILKEMRELKAG